MTLEEITKEVREICKEWLTEAQIDATAQAIWIVKHGVEIAGQKALFCLGGAISWMITGKMIPEKTGLQIEEIAKRLNEEDDEPCGSAN